MLLNIKNIRKMLFEEARRNPLNLSILDNAARDLMILVQNSKMDYENELSLYLDLDVFKEDLIGISENNTKSYQNNWCKEQKKLLCIISNIQSQITD